MLKSNGMLECGFCKKDIMPGASEQVYGNLQDAKKQKNIHVRICYNCYNNILKLKKDL